MTLGILIMFLILVCASYAFIILERKMNVNSKEQVKQAVKEELMVDLYVDSLKKESLDPKKQLEVKKK